MRLAQLARECGWRPAIRELSPTEASDWIGQHRERFQLPRDHGLWHGLWDHALAQDAGNFHEEVPADDSTALVYFEAAGRRRSYRPRLTGTFADYQRMHGLPLDGVTRAVYGDGPGFPRDLPPVLEMPTDDAARCLHAIYSVTPIDILVVDCDLRWIVCVFHHGVTRVTRLIHPSRAG